MFERNKANDAMSIFSYLRQLSLTISLSACAVSSMTQSNYGPNTESEAVLTSGLYRIMKIDHSMHDALIGDIFIKCHQGIFRLVLACPNSYGAVEYRTIADQKASSWRSLKEEHHLSSVLKIALCQYFYKLNEVDLTEVKKDDLRLLKRQHLYQSILCMKCYWSMIGNVKMTSVCNKLTNDLTTPTRIKCLFLSTQCVDVGVLRAVCHGEAVAVGGGEAREPQASGLEYAQTGNGQWQCFEAKDREHEPRWTHVSCKYDHDRLLDLSQSTGHDDFAGADGFGDVEFVGVAADEGDEAVSSGCSMSFRIGQQLSIGAQPVA